MISAKLEDVLALVAAERARQDARWGEQNHAPAVWLAILTEEVGDVARAILKAPTAAGEPAPRAQDLGHYEEELVQAAAVAVVVIQCLRRHQREGAEALP